MKTIDQQITIAEATGWIDVEICAVKGTVSGWFGGQWANVPDYPTDLNAMFSAAMWLCAYNGSGYFIYLDELRKIAGEYNVDATAPQRAEAFLKALGLWKPTK